MLLLKTLTESCVKKEQWGTQMLPCCGFTYFPNDALDTVDICGCPNGIDWLSIHCNGSIKLITEVQKETIIDIETYRKKVHSFVDKIEDFYKKSSPKNIPKDSFDRDGYTAFWNEWRRRRQIENPEY